MRVYRIETQCGTGAFGSGGAYLYNQNTRRGDDCYNPPGAHNEAPETALHQFYLQMGSRELPNNIRFGFESLEQLQRWFKCPSGRENMKLSGCMLNVYEVPEGLVMRGSWQVIYNRDFAEFVETLDLRTLERNYEHRLDRIDVVRDCGSSYRYD